MGEFRAGVHLPNDGHLSPADLALLPGLRLVKALLRLDTLGEWGEVRWPELVQVLGPDCLVILRLYWPGFLEADEFSERAARRLCEVLPVLAPRRVLVELHNEPNHCTGLEGWGSSDDDAAEFAWWFYQAREGLRSRGFGGGSPHGRLGWPGLALGEWVHRERSWCEINRLMIRSSGWIGCHCYWQRPEEIDAVQLGANWRWYRGRWPRRPLYVTEVANSSCHNPELAQPSPDEQCAQYLRWCQLASAGGVKGAAFYLLGGSDEWAGFRLHPETVRALAAFEG